MSSFIYWLFLALIVALLAYASLFSLVPFMFLGGGMAVGLTYIAFLVVRRRRSGRWEHDVFQFRFHAVLFTFIFVFWTAIGLFTNNKAHREFPASYEPYIASDGSQDGYVFHYIGFPNAYERVNSAALNRHLEETQPERVRIVLETVKDFGKLRAYSVAEIDGIPVNAAWSGGTPPWESLR